MMTLLQQHYRALEAFLQEHRTLWQPAPFHTPTPPWAETNAALYNALLALPDDDTCRLEHDIDALLSWLGQYLPTLSALPALIALPACHGDLPRPWPTGFEWDIPGRKWSQIEAFAAMFQPHGSRVIDWCAGKGHLSRSLAFQHEIDVQALEWNAALCEAASSLTRKTDSRVTPILQDVMAANAARHIDAHCHCVALHACGKLHVRLMQAAADQGAMALSFSPCCYHLINEAVYVPLTSASAPDLSQRLQLTRDELRLAVQETVTANGHARRLGERKRAWKLGFRALLAALPAAPEHRVPSLPDRFFHGRFVEFCEQLALQLGVMLPTGVAWDTFEQAGWQAHGRLQRLELVRHGFRRALEVWLCLDRACWLEQRGYEVEVGTFCEARVTPRNVLIRAVRMEIPVPSAGVGG